MTKKLLSIHNLTISFPSSKGRVEVVKGLNLNINKGQIVGLAGESGSGKSVTAMSILRLNPSPPAKVESGSIKFLGSDLLTMPLGDLQKLRGQDISVIFQEPMTALSPLHSIGSQLVETLQLHQNINKSKALKIAMHWLQKVEIPDVANKIKAYPFELSGGQRQRVMIAMALMLAPKLIIADEPTTALDVTIQKQIFKLMLDLKNADTAMLFITHDMGVIWQMCDRVAVMQNGYVVEEGAVKQLLTHPKHAYTQQLIKSVPRLNTNDKHISQSPKEVLLQVQDLHTWYPIKQGIFAKTVDYVKAVNGVSFDIRQGETLALVGESGCGKTTLGRTLMGLEVAKAGAINFAEVDLLKHNLKHTRQMRQSMQMVFQDPYSALNPKMRICDIITEALVVHNIITANQRWVRATELLDEVGLSSKILNRYPHEFSGGQRQRICIARALGLKPKLIILDESLSALDVSIQAKVIELLQELKQRHRLSYLFISHDLSVVSQISDRIAVMQKGKIVEIGLPSQIIANPQNSYTQTLISAIPVLGS